MSDDLSMPPPRTRLPFFYGWVLVGIAFVTMAVGVNARTAFSLLFPPILDEFGWDRGMTAGAFSFGFLASEGQGRRRTHHEDRGRVAQSSSSKPTRASARARKPCICA
jgi:hypothetical protein